MEQLFCFYFDEKQGLRAGAKIGDVLNGVIPGPVLIEDSVSNYFFNLERAKKLGFNVPDSIIPFLGFIFCSNFEKLFFFLTKIFLLEKKKQITFTHLLRIH